MPDPKKECVLAKVTQFQCKRGKYIVCRPIERLFKQCPGVPSVELVQQGDSYVDIKTHSDVNGLEGGI
ncbi:hypothetical protein DL89DRAFT_265730 [Linderina pennispora]|uniref:Uncharacterized protein n=1 Tax=Linderina pennispora TaxID=61395 RepID=A0A1Y1WEV9_9FUNG|nr:uncharacterized protein DL89DRAFT_265730 [Linderina pennispora]ORX72070.1 hypothetical protein DL89DRAFT_265730 [Linderina pennispora]